VSFAFGSNAWKTGYLKDQLRIPPQNPCQSLPDNRSGHPIVLQAQNGRGATISYHFVCRSNPPNAAFQDAPTVVAEVLSDSTRRLDFGEKKEAYLTIPSLEVYLLVEPERLKVIAYRRTEQGFVKEEWEGLAAVLPLPEISVELPLGEIYKNVSITEDT